MRSRLPQHSRTRDNLVHRGLVRLLVDVLHRRASLERFRRMGKEYVRFALENPAHYRLMYGKEALTREDAPELREAAIALFEQLVGVIEAHQRSGGSGARAPEYRRESSRPWG